MNKSVASGRDRWELRAREVRSQARLKSWKSGEQRRSKSLGSRSMTFGAPSLRVAR
jgi:hypothetical protein